MNRATIRSTTFRNDLICTESAVRRAFDRESERSKVGRLSIIKGQRVNVKAHCQDGLNGKTRGGSIAEHSRSDKQERRQQKLRPKWIEGQKTKGVRETIVVDHRTCWCLWRRKRSVEQERERESTDRQNKNNSGGF
jgi:hypothetical protein